MYQMVLSQCMGFDLLQLSCTGGQGNWSAMIHQRTWGNGDEHEEVMTNFVEHKGGALMSSEEKRWEGQIRWKQYGQQENIWEDTHHGR